VNLLLDTHLILWWLDGASRLSKKATDLISDPSHTVFVSAASVWEIRIKEALGKVRLPSNFAQTLDEEFFETMPVTVEDAHAVKELPLLHRDPFDRMLIVQAKRHEFTLLTSDGMLAKYPVDCVVV
jgi:PIN domain nuclease of toxin-antitoxin system